MDDGKVNAMSISMLEALHAAFGEAERDQTIVVLTGRGRAFSAGFDLKVLASGSAQEIYTMLKAGGELALHILSFPRPVVAACNGHAFPMGAFLLLAADVRLAVAQSLSKLNLPAHTATKLQARGPTIQAMRAAIDTEMTLAYAEQQVASRTASA